GVTALGIGCYSTLIYLSLTRDDPRLKRIPRDASDRFDDNAWVYDSSVDTMEWLMGISKRRKEMASMARGHLLEVAAGTGRNHAFYDTKKLATVTMLDQSAQMLAVGKKKWKDEHPEYARRISWRTQSALEPIAPPPQSPDGFDYVIQTMGLCSTAEPVKLLQNLGEVAKPEGGRILLLEHGRSHYAWLNRVLDKTAAAHADEHGCWWNKDIGKIVEESGLEVVKLRRYNFGTTWWVELKPKPRRRLGERIAGHAA
ncbi:S-adenosyl-L-methionine-dependent methyltransferase, partial [Lophium mytilinum]